MAQGQVRRVAVVTGASGGVGRATAVELAQRGFDVALLARGAAGLDGAAKEVERAGARALPCVVDICDAQAVDDVASRVEDTLGPIDVWVNDAMTTVFAPFSEVEPEDFRRAIEVTFLGQVWGTRAALRRMRPRDRGTIVNVGSALAFIGITLQSPYCSAKFACRGFFESVRAELIHDRSNVRLSMVHLPAVNTTQFDWCRSKMDRRPMPVAPVYQPELAARAIADVAEDGRRAKNLGTWNKLLVGASKVSPAFANQFAGVATWDTQLTDEPTRPGDPENLWHPADRDDDFGTHGRFDDHAGGVLDPSFLKTLPHTAKQFAVAAAATAREKLARWPRAAHSSSRS